MCQYANMFTETIIEWYKENKRDLPWRDSSDPYLIWISEIILQQTRVAQGYDYLSDAFPMYLHWRMRRRTR